MAVIIDGREVAKNIRAKIREEVTVLRSKGIVPSLAVILVGNDPASSVYVRNKQKACYDTGIEPIQITLPEDVTENQLLAYIEKLNSDKKINGILVQLPLPKGISSQKIISAISPEKDVDCFTRENVGKIVEGNYGFLPCTPYGIMELLEHYGIEVSGKECVVVGRSGIVGKPMALLLLNKNGTVTVAHSKTQNLKEVCLRADILVAAVGKPEFITAQMVKRGAVVIDVGINRREDGSLIGDVATDVKDVASYITPVPGGVGPMTIAMLLKNTLYAAKIQNNE